MKTGRRSYQMTARAEAVEATGHRILDALVELFVERPSAQITLREVAARAGVSVQTVMRRYGDKEGLLAAAAERDMAVVGAQRGTARPGDVAGAVDILLDHYDDFGGVALRLLAEEDSTPALAPITRNGRQFHREWCARVFAPWLGPLHGVDRERRLAQLVAVCDVYTWKLLHLDAGLSRRQVRVALLEMLAPLTPESPS